MSSPDASASGDFFSLCVPTQPVALPPPVEALAVSLAPDGTREWQLAAFREAALMGDAGAALQAFRDLARTSYVEAGLDQFTAEFHRAALEVKLKREEYEAHRAASLAASDMGVTPSFSEESRLLKTWGKAQELEKAAGEARARAFAAFEALLYRDIGDAFGSEGSAGLEISEQVHVVLAETLVSLQEHDYAREHYGHASRKSQTDAEKQWYFLLGERLRTDDELRSRREGYAKLFETTLPALQHGAGELASSEGRFEADLAEAQTFIEAVEGTSSAEELQGIIASFAERSPRAVHAVGLMTEPQEGDPHIAELYGIDPQDPRWKDAGVQFNGEDFPRAGSAELAAKARLVAWEILYRIDAEAGGEQRRATENALMEMVEERWQRERGTVLLDEAVLYANGMRAMLNEATKRYGDLEVALRDGGTAAAESRFALYQQRVDQVMALLETYHGPGEAALAREMIAGLKFKLAHDGRMAMHDYQQAIGSDFAQQAHEYADTEEAAARIRMLAELYPHRFANGCLLTDVDFTDDDRGIAAAARETSFFDHHTDSGTDLLALLGVGAGAGAVAGAACLLGGASGGVAGSAVEPGGGTAVGAASGCKLFIASAAFLSGLVYKGSQQAYNVEIHGEHIAAARRAGLSQVGEDEATSLRWQSRLELALAGAMATPAGRIGGGLGEGVVTGLRAMGKEAAVGFLSPAAAGAGARATEPLLMSPLQEGGAAAAVSTAGRATARQRAFQLIALRGQGGWKGFLGGGWSYTKDALGRIWQSNVRDSFYRPVARLTPTEHKFITWVGGAAAPQLETNAARGVAAKVVQAGLQAKEPLMWVPGSAYAIHDYAADGQLSFAGGVAGAFPVNQASRIAFQLETGGSLVAFGFAVGLEYLSQVQAGNEYKAPDGFRLLVELAAAAPLRFGYNVVVKGKSRYMNSLAELPLEAGRRAAYHTGIGRRVFRSIEHPEYEDLLWRTVASPERRLLGHRIAEARAYKLHTMSGRALQLAWMSPIVAGGLYAQAQNQDADFERLIWQRGVWDYGVGAFWIIPRFKAPLGMSTAVAELSGRFVAGGGRILLNEIQNKYKPRVDGVRVGVANYEAAPEYDYSYALSKFERGINSLNPVKGMDRSFVEDQPLFSYETWYGPDRLGLVGFQHHLVDVLSGGSTEFPDYGASYNVHYQVHASSPEITIGRAADHLLDILETSFKRGVDAAEHPITMRDMMTAATLSLQQFAARGEPRNETEWHLLTRVQQMQRRYQPQMAELLRRGRLENPSLMRELGYVASDAEDEPLTTAAQGSEYIKEER